ncbi:MAG: serine--tRNA ligase [Rhodospirillales bacterium]|nr:serine--tRNA ligase [Rhodospirillales bacterium]
MFAMSWIRANPEQFDAGLVRRGLEPQAAAVLQVDARRRKCLTDLQAAQTERNTTSRDIGARKAAGEDAADLVRQVGDLKRTISDLQTRADQLDAQVQTMLSELPNLPAADVPDGPDERANQELWHWGEPPTFAFEARDHVTLGEALGLMDFQRSARMSGARFVILTGALARLERALTAFMMDLQTQEHGYQEVSPPAMVREAALYGTGQLPKFAEDLFQTTDGYWLIPTAEVPLTNLVAGEIQDGATLPQRYTALTPCYRAEAGAGGRDNRGMIRMHQFSKVELVSITRPEDSDTELQRMTRCAETVLRRLGLAYRVVLLSSGDMGFAARKTLDLEVWLPGQEAFREISSCSNCGDFQARRMNARYRHPDSGDLQHVHTLNGSGVAAGRLLIAVMENFQEADGSITVPDVLRPYLGHLERISAAAT